MAVGLFAVIVATNSLDDARRLAVAYRTLYAVMAAGAMAAAIVGWARPAPWLLAVLLVVILTVLWAVAVRGFLLVGAWGKEPTSAEGRRASSLTVEPGGRNRRWPVCPPKLDQKLDHHDGSRRYEEASHATPLETRVDESHWGKSIMVARAMRAAHVTLHALNVTRCPVSRCLALTRSAPGSADRYAGRSGPRGRVDEVIGKDSRVAFVGDGVNDGRALAAADVGGAMGRGGTDVAIETAEIALLSDGLSRLPHLLDLARRALRAIYQNLCPGYLWYP